MAVNHWLDHVIKVKGMQLCIKINTLFYPQGLMKMSTSFFTAAHIIIRNQRQIKLHKSLGGEGEGTTVNAEFQIDFSP